MGLILKKRFLLLLSACLPVLRDLTNKLALVIGFWDLFQILKIVDAMKENAPQLVGFKVGLEPWRGVLVLVLTCLADRRV
jgi:hypothetical protein